MDFVSETALLMKVSLLNTRFLTGRVLLSTLNMLF